MDTEGRFGLSSVSRFAGDLAIVCLGELNSETSKPGEQNRKCAGSNRSSVRGQVVCVNCYNYKKEISQRSNEGSLIPQRTFESLTCGGSYFVQGSNDPAFCPDPSNSC